MKKFYVTANGKDFRQLAKASGGNAQTINLNGEQIYYLNEDYYESIQGGTDTLKIFKDNDFNAFETVITCENVLSFPQIDVGGTAAWYLINGIETLYDKSVQISVGSAIAGFDVGMYIMAGSGNSGIEAFGVITAQTGSSPHLISIKYNSDGNFMGSNYGAGGTSIQFIGSGATWISPGQEGITDGTTSAPHYTLMTEYPNCLTYYDPSDYNNHWKFLRPFNNLKIISGLGGTTQYVFNNISTSDKRWKLNT